MYCPCFAGLLPRFIALPCLFRLVALSLPVRLEYRARGTLGVVLAVHLKDPRNITGSLNPTMLVSSRGFKNELCHLRSVLVSAHCFKKELCFLCSVLVLTHRFKNDLCVPCLFRLMALRTSSVAF